MDLDAIKAGIVQEVTAGVIAKLSPEVKTQIVAEALRGVIGDYKFISAVSERLRTIADCQLDELLKTVEFDKLLCDKFQEGIDLFMAALPKAVATAMVGTLVGPREYKSGAVYKGLCDVLGIDRTD